MPKIATLNSQTSNHYKLACAEKVCWKLLHPLWLGIANTYLWIRCFLKWGVQANQINVFKFVCSASQGQASRDKPSRFINLVNTNMQVFWRNVGNVFAYISIDFFVLLENG